MEIRSGSWRAAFVRGMAAWMAIITVVQVPPAIGAPSDVFSAPAPVIGADPPKATDIKAGDASVSTQTGAFTYSYPIQVPPGRNGMAAQLALSYSSQAAIYGGIAAGWSLSIPEIREDTSQSRLVSRSLQVESQQADPRRDDQFVSSMAGGRPLVAVTEPTSTGVYQTYRAQNDASFARYERMDTGQPFRWRVYTTDGIVMTFGEASRLSLCVNVNDQYAPLTGVVDSFGNEVKYTYSGDAIVGECRISTITWGQNTNPAIAQSFAQVVFGWGVQPSCTTPAIQPGSFRDYHSVTPDKPPIITGASKLLTIMATAFPPGTPGSPEHTRLITLGYDPNSELCNRSYSPVRLLTSIQESAWGRDSPRVDLPRVTFDYGDPAIALTSNVKQSVPWSDLHAIPTRRNNLAWGYRRLDDRWPSLEAMLLDIDGDGLLDRVTNAEANPLNTISSCTAKWQRNLGPNASGNIIFSGTFNSIALPRLKWRGTDSQDPNALVAGAASAQRWSPSYEGCSLNGQVTAYQNSVTAFANCHAPNTSGSSTDPTNHQTYCFPGGTEYPPGAGGPQSADYRTYLAYRWLDADGDGLTDLVAAVHGDIDAYDIERGNRVNYSGGEPGISGIPGVGNWPACPGKGDRCKVFADCLKGSRTCSNGVCTPLWDVVNQCLITQSSTGCFQITAAGGPGGSTPSRAPYMRCEGLYPWFIYKNQGNGSFATTPVIKYQPVQLESHESDSAMTGPSVAAEDHAIVDFDGDGILDALVRDSVAHSGAWQVWLGDGTGGFGTKLYVYMTRNDNRLSSQGFTPTPLVSSSAGLFDINGDGLQDHWVPSAPFNVAISDGTQHRLYLPGITLTGEIETPANVKPGSDTNYTVTLFSVTGAPLEGSSSAQNRLVDVDNDGRPDVVSFTPSPVVDVDNDGRPDVVSFTPSPVVYWNGGGQFLSTSKAYPGVNDNGIKRRTEGWQTGDLPATGEALFWELKGDLTDLDGNGIPESVYFAGTVLNRNKETLQPSTTQPPRLIKAIHNGRGGHVAPTYASMHDPSATVEQHPELRWTDTFCPTTKACPKASPREQWVVKSLAVTDAFQPGVTSTTSYLYKNPRHSPDDRGHYGFRGFETVITTAPSLATTEQTYGYDVDWSGRLTKTLVKPKPTESATDVRSIDKTTWERRSLFGGAITTYHATISEHFACANGQTEAACTPSAAPAYTRTTTILTALASTTQAGGSALLWQETASLLQAGTAAADGDRQTVSTFALNADAATYRLRPRTSTRQNRSLVTMMTFGRTARTWDATYRVPLTDEVWVDNVDANRSIERRVYDMATGNVIERWKPKQNAARTTKTTFTYDSRKLFVATETNELGHARDYTFEYGTSTKLITMGPNIPGCAPNCGRNPLKEEHKVRIDGLGRPIERWETFGEDGASYVLYEVDQTSYDDTSFATNGTATSATHQAVISRSSGGVFSWTKDKTELDGHGRPIKKTTYVFGSAPADYVTTFAYASDGTLTTVTTPDPTANNTTTVEYTYTYDSLGRPSSIRRPDSTTQANQSGANRTYDGVTSTLTEVVGAAAGQVAVIRTRSDAFGRLVEVDEQRVASPATWAATLYTYGPDDNVAQVTDPQGNVTTMTHDFAGHRTGITRGTRVWSYTYDKNGNIDTETVPGWTSALDKLNFITSIVYDDLDRSASKSVGQRTLSAADQTLFASGTETYIWDSGLNHTGRLRYWKTYAPGVATEATQVNLLNDAQGQINAINETITLAGYSGLTRQIYTNYNLNGQRRFTYYRDQVGGSNQTASEVSLDARGLPASVLVTRDGQPILNVGVQTRSVAGLVTKWRTDQTGAMTFIEANWTCDKLGRVTSQVVRKGPGPTQVVRQDLTYFGNDDPKTLTHYLGSTSKLFDFGYDLRHQLTSASATTAGYFSGTYAYGNAGRFTRATVAQTTNPLPGGTEVKARDVNYVYGGADPEQVTALTNVAGGATYASYTYDAAGNQTNRTYPATNESWDYVYDGKDQLRRATKKLSGVVQSSEEYWYDGFGQRLVIVKRNAAGTKTELVWFIGETEAHYTGAGLVSHVYSHISMGAPVARVDRTGNTTTAVEYQFHGLASNTIAAVDQGGTVNASFSYAPFGEVIEATNAGSVGAGTAAHKRRLNDKLEDDVSGLAYYGARYYDKTLIGWTQGDPLYTRVPDAAQPISPRRANVYVFSLQNSLRYMDPDGLDADSNAPWTKNPSGLPRYGGDLGDAVSGGRPMFDVSMSQPPKDCGTSPPGICDPNAGSPMSVMSIKAIFLDDNWEKNRQVMMQRYNVDLGEDPFDAVGEWVVKRATGVWGLVLGILDEGHEACGTLDCAKRAKQRTTADDIEALARADPGALGRPGARSQGGRKADTRQIDRIVKDVGLNKEQRQLLHRAIEKMNFTLDEIRDIATDIMTFMPKKGKGK